MARKPRLDTMVLFAQTNKNPAFLITARVIEKGTAIFYMHVLDNPDASAHGRGMTEDEYAPALFFGVLLQQVLEPNGLGLGDVDFMGGEGGGTETGGAQADAQCFLPDLMAEGWEIQAESVLPGLQIFDVRGEFVHALEVVISKGWEGKGRGSETRRGSEARNGGTSNLPSH